MKISLLLINLLFIVSLTAQPSEEKQRLPEAQFDFWVGKWQLSWGEDGAGYNRIEKILDGKIIQENFDGLSSIKLRGMSVSAFDRQTQRWKQTWVDNLGGYLDFSGGWQQNRMILSRQFKKENLVIMQRMVWYNIRENDLDWNWEKSIDGGNNWEVLWKIHYHREKK